MRLRNLPTEMQVRIHAEDLLAQAPDTAADLYAAAQGLHRLARLAWDTADALPLCQEAGDLADETYRAVSYVGETAWALSAALGAALGRHARRTGR